MKRYSKKRSFKGGKRKGGKRRGKGKSIKTYRMSRGGIKL